MHSNLRATRAVFVFLVALTAVGLAGCGGGGGGGGSGASAPLPPPPQTQCGQPTPWPAALPQDHPYQVTLRDFLACQTLEAFQLELQPITYDDAFLLTTEDVHRTWLLLENVGRSPPPVGKGLGVAPEHFMLSAIENNGQVNMTIGRGYFIDVPDTAWWAEWNYQGNPYYGSSAVKMRAFVAAAVDMMMLDQNHDQTNNHKRSDYLGGSMISHAYAYYVAKDILPTEVQDAYEAGLLRELEKMETWGATGTFGDLDTFGLVGLFYLDKALGDPAVRTRIEAFVKDQVFPKVYREAGYIYHGGGFDPSYQGVSFRFLIWAALLADWPWLTEQVESMIKLRSYLTIPEPDEGIANGDNRPNHFGPSHFATANDSGPPNDQWGPYWREVAGAMLVESGQYLAWGPRRYPWWYVMGAPDESLMRTQLATYLPSDFNNRTTAPVADAPIEWRQTHWTDGINYAHELYQPGTYLALRTLVDQESELRLPPLLRQPDIVENCGDEFLVAKFGDVATVVHTGPLSNWGNETAISGLGGGALSVFWTKGTGSVLLGKTSGFQGPTRDQWDAWRTWPTHAVSGQTDDGKPFSSARIKAPTATFNVGATSASVDVSGSLSDSFPAPDDALTGEVTYSRSFSIDANGAQVTSTVTSDATDTVTELYDIIPIFRKDLVLQQDLDSTEIDFQIDGAWVDATTTLQSNVTAVRIGRFGSFVYIDFDSPQRVKLSGADWAADYQTDASARNVMVDLLGNDGAAVTLPASTSVTYTFKTSLD